MKGKLKNYIDYYNKLLDYAKVCHINVFMAELYENQDEKDLGEYLYESRTINLNKKLTQKELIATLLHELGHFEDHKINGINEKVEQAYKNLNNGVLPTVNQKRLIVECEQKAWDYGESLAKKLKIPLGSWYTKEVLAGMTNYYSLKTRK